jgi:osmotically inducible lipoprotein OsmB
MKKWAMPIMALALTTGLTACANMTPHAKQTTGLVAGGAVGGIAGSALTGGSPAGAVVGAVGGAYVGQEIGKRQ